MDQVVQLIGAVLILAAFVLTQQRRMATDSVVYLALNAVGAALLTAVAVLDRDIGFTLLEATWTAVSTVGLVKCLRGSSGTGRLGEPERQNRQTVGACLPGTVKNAQDALKRAFKRGLTRKGSRVPAE